MKNLTEFDCLCLRQRGSPEQTAIDIKAVLPNVVFVPANKLKTQIAALQAMTGAFVLVLPAFIEPMATFATVKPDPILLDAGFQLAWYSSNIVTGELTDETGPELWKRSSYLATLEAVLAGEASTKKAKFPLAVMPDCQAIWAFNTSSGAAFGAGHNHVFHLRNSDLKSIELSTHLRIAATLGRDVDFCDWWHLGVLQAILGSENKFEAYKFEKTVTKESGTMRQRLDDLYRDVRLTAGLDVKYMPAKTSRFFKKGKFLMPPRSAYSHIANQYIKLGAAGATLSRRYNEAADWVWAEA